MTTTTALIFHIAGFFNGMVIGGYLAYRIIMYRLAKGRF